MISPEELAFKAAAKTSLGSAIVPGVPPVDMLTIPNTLLDRLSKMTLNCSTNWSFDLSQFSKSTL